MQTSPFPQGQSHKGGSPTTSRRPGSKDSNPKGIWLSMLDEVSRGKDLAEKQLIILGGTPDQQRAFLHTLHPPSEASNNTNRHRRINNNQNRTTQKSIPISNRFTLGYTYHDVLDTDGEDILARLSIHMLSNPSAAFAPLLKPLFTAKTVPSTLVTVLLDWDDPFKWPRQLRQWVRVLRKVVEGLDQEIKEVMEETMKGWKEGRIGAGITGGEAKAVDAPLGPGEWEDELGVPLSVVCLNAEKQERMEKEYGWQEGDFDLVLQWMRCVLLKHGASLIYTTSFDSNNVRTLIHSSLGIQSILKRETVKHNVIDRDKIMIPPNWDSWGKIRILREGFEMETVANAWSVEIQFPPETEFDPSATKKPTTNGDTTLQQTGSGTLPSTSDESQETSISLFTSSLPNPLANSKPFVPSTSTSDRVTVPDTQTFLAAQAQVLERYRQVDEHSERERQKRGPSESELLEQRMERKSAAAHALLEEVARHQQPYKINVGGIQVDAEEVTRRIREREADRDRESTRTPTRKGSAGGSGIATPDGGKVDNEALTNYFQGLLKKAKESSESQSQSHSPRGGSSLAGDR